MEIQEHVRAFRMWVVFVCRWYKQRLLVISLRGISEDWQLRCARAVRRDRFCQTWSWKSSSVSAFIHWYHGWNCCSRNSHASSLHFHLHHTGAPTVWSSLFQINYYSIQDDMRLNLAWCKAWIAYGGIVIVADAGSSSMPSAIVHELTGLAHRTFPCSFC